MRELKFRVWIGKEYLDDFNLDRISVGSNRSLSVIGYPGVIIEQFTGLVDRHGVEIYEGDMLKAKHDDGQYDTGEVVYGSKGAFCLYLPCVASGIKTPLLNYIHGMMFPEYDFEVIGNIHENGELLK